MFIDIAVNATWDNMVNNLDEIVRECKENNVLPIFCGLDIESSQKCLELADKFKTGCYLGIHPNHIPEDYESQLEALKKLDFSNERVLGIGECGLDYLRSNKVELQKIVFSKHLRLFNDYKLPFFYHCRDSAKDFLEMAVHPGVVHSFDGTAEEADQILKKGLFIGINGCSLKKEESINVVKGIPIDKILIETDSPFCQIRKSYAASEFVTVTKDKNNRPVNVIQIAQAISIIKNIPLEDVEKIVYENTLKVFPRLRKIAENWNLSK